MSLLYYLFHPRIYSKSLKFIFLNEWSRNLFKFFTQSLSRKKTLNEPQCCLDNIIFLSAIYTSFFFKMELSGTIYELDTDIIKNINLN